MKIPEKANSLHMPITQNIPVNLKDTGAWYKQTWKWMNGLPNELLYEDFYQILPSDCNKCLGFSKNHKVCVFIPKMFIFNGASIPKVLSFTYLPHGILYLGAFLHDFCYSYGGLIVFTEESDKLMFVKVSQKEADLIFYEMNQEVNDSRVLVKPAYYTLRMFGWITWNKCRKNPNDFIERFPHLTEVYNEGAMSIDNVFYKDV